MKFRRSRNFHYVNAINGVLSVKVQNVSRGGPGLKFKTIRNILESGNAENHNFIPALCSRVVYDRYAEIKSEPRDFKCIVDHDRKISNQEDLSFGDTTLRQLKAKCKANKRKLPMYIDSSTETIETNSQLCDEEIDLTQPLSSWKFEPSKNKKRKKTKKHVKNSLCASSESAQVVVKSEQFSSYHEFLQCNGPINIKVELSELNCDSLGTICNASISFRSRDEQMGVGVGLSTEVPETGNNCVLPTKPCGLSTKESQSSVDKEYHGFQDHTEPDSADCVLPKEIRSSVNEDSDKSQEHDSANDGLTDCEIVRLDSTERISHHYTEYPGPKSQEEMYTIHPASQKHDNSQNLRKKCIRSIQDEQSACLLADDISKVLPSNLESTAISPDERRTFFNFDVFSSPDVCLASVPYYLSTTDRKQFQSSFLADSAKVCSYKIRSDDPPFETKLSEIDHQRIKPHPPEKLFSTRKFQAISPTFREKFSNAMESAEIHGNRQDKCKGKLLFGKPKQIRSNGVSINQKHFIRKAKYKDNSHSSQSCSQTAITFSQRQMQDTEYLADRLTKELNSMIEIVRDAVYFEANSASALKHNVDKVRMGIDKATKVEESSKRYLSMMARDCIRFCKIMKLSEDDSSASNNVTPKERKKITFADEAGKKLCHVKILDGET